MSFWPFRSPSESGAQGRKKTTRQVARAARKYARLELEALEDRALPSGAGVSGTVISGFVYHDLNNNGLYEPAAGETPYANTGVELLNAAGAIVGTTATDANGYYQFAADSTINTSPQTLTYTATFPSTLTNFSLTQAVQQFDPSLGTLLSATITNNGTITSDIKAENTSSTSGTLITGNVGGDMTLSGPGVALTTSPDRNTGTFNASAFDGTIDFAGTSGTDFGPRTASASNAQVLTGSALSPFIGTGTVNLNESAVATSTASGGGNVLVSVTSSAQATVTVTYRYTPSNALRPGNYTIVETTQPPGTLDGKVSSNGTVLNNPPGQDVIPVTVTGPNLPNNDFGKLYPSGLSGYVYLDASPAGTNDGLREPGEPGIPGVGVTLTGTNGQGSVNVPTATDGNGFYHFDNLLPGTYTITETHPAGYIDGKATIGNQGGLAGSDVLYNIVLAPGVAGVNNNFGELTPVVSSPPLPPPNVPAADLQIVKTASAATVPVGSAVTYTLTVSNLGPNTATGVTVRDNLPAGVTFVSAAGAGWQESEAAGIVTFTAGSLASGASATLTVNILAPNTVGTITNVSTVTSNTSDTNMNNNTSQATVAVVAPTGISQAVYAPVPAGFPSPTDISVLGKNNLFNVSGSTDPTLLGQISFVDSLYRTLLGRPSDNAGLIYWVTQLRQGTSRPAVVQSFWTSASHRDVEVETLYRTYLGRDAGAGDFAYWNGVFAGGANENTVAAMIIASPEFAASHPDPASFIDSLYRSALGRPVDAAGLAYWQGVLAGSGRQAVAYAILSSDEASLRMLGLAYGNFLGRAPSGAEQQWWLAQVHSGVTQAQIAQMILSSDEFYSRAASAA
jgi:uncharacterized repeat protein (TIGR01451 family)